MPFAETWMDLETVIQTEVSQKEKDKYHIISLICGIEKNSVCSGCNFLWMSKKYSATF